MWFASLIQQWPSAAALADDIAAQERAVASWRARDSIPAEWFAPVARAAQARGFRDITVELLAARAEARRLAHRADRQLARAS